MAKGNSSPTLKIPHRSPKTKAKDNKLLGPIRIIHSDSSVSVSNLFNLENVSTNQKSSSFTKSKSSISIGSKDSDLSSQAKNSTIPEVDVDDEVTETPYLCCRLFALLATCFEHVEDHIEGGKTWCKSKFSKGEEITAKIDEEEPVRF